MDEPLVPLSSSVSTWTSRLGPIGPLISVAAVSKSRSTTSGGRRSLVRLLGGFLTERRESEARVRKTAEARDKLHQAQWVAPRGLPAGAVPEGLSPAAYMGLSDRPGGRRTTLDAGSLFGDGDSLEFHPYPREAE